MSSDHDQHERGDIVDKVLPGGPVEDADDHEDPRLQQPVGDEGMPGTFDDEPENLPGDQPVDDTPPSRTKATGDD